ncbi:MAG TPA: phosphoribosyl-AMP cyclohydrolase [Methanobacterium sp.]|jgi:phosphoribosyl-AMP cyclohydrolase|nr:MAG: phosphoribosyl-AMP cyclohydrolase [Methanobacterium sp.]HOI70696.1 phosphoribosyl-AMP cyclohydrolase [Methanobacterium sp.]HPX78176.1 phosphoribosyl-AMP cyclohydrolase [Methanobacterium sp.]
MNIPDLNFRLNRKGEDLIIAVAQDFETSEVLMVAFMNREALMKTIETGNAHYWSTSRGKLWLKGESSGHLQKVQEILTDCDKDAVILKVQQEGAACHEGYYSCFFRELIREDEGVNLKIIKEKVFQPENVYGEK